MHEKIRKILKWSPRVLIIALMLFFAVFSLDVFGEYKRAVETIVAFLMHMIPVFIIGIMLYFTWNNQKLGFMIFGILGIISFFFFDGYESIGGFLATTLPFILIAGLYYFSWKSEKNNKK